MKTALSPYRAWWGPDCHQEFIDHVLDGRFRAVYLTTPPTVTESYLRRLAAAGEDLVAVSEKPWFADYHSALDLAGDLDNSAVRFRFFDHYLYREAVQFLSRRRLAKWLGGPVRSIRVRLFESAPWTSAAQGETGILRDLLIHAVSVCCQLLPDEELTVTAAEAARHSDSEYDTETYAWLQLRGGDDAAIPIELSAAKFIPAELAGKQMIVAGDDARLEIDLSADTVDLVEAGGKQRLYPDGDERLPDAYQVLVEKLAAADDRIGFELHEALHVLRLLDDAQRMLEAKPLVSLNVDDYPPQQISQRASGLSLSK